MSAPYEPTTALGHHRLETAFNFWRNGAALVKREPPVRRQVYERAVAAVVATLADVSSIPALVAAYYHVTPARWQALTDACDVDTGLLPPNAGIVEDAAFYARYQALARAAGYHPLSDAQRPGASCRGCDGHRVS